MHKNAELEYLLTLMCSSTPEKVVNSAQKMIASVQHLPVEEQILGIASLLLLMCERYGFNHYGDILGQTHNYLYSPNLNPQFKALKRYFKEIFKN